MIDCLQVVEKILAWVGLLILAILISRHNRREPVIACDHCGKKMSADSNTSTVTIDDEEIVDPVHICDDCLDTVKDRIAAIFEPPTIKPAEES